MKKLGESIAGAGPVETSAENKFGLVGSIIKERPLLVESLEPRILFSASPAPEPAPETAAPDVQEAPAPAPAESAEAEPAAPGNDAGGAEVSVAAPPAVETVESEAIPESVETISVALTEADVAAVAEAAAQRWKDSGHAQVHAEALASITYMIADLEGEILGSTEGNVITIDIDAAGRSWFVDETPEDDSEFELVSGDTKLAAQEDAAATGIDLLSVIMHEQGHVLGLDESGSPNDVMFSLFYEGDRRLPERAQLRGVEPLSLEGTHNAVAASDYQAAVLAQNPAFFFDFSETSGTTVNSVVNGTTGSVQGTVDLNVQGPDPSDSAVGFAAGANRIDISDDPVTGATNLSGSAWIKLDPSALGNSDDLTIFTKGPFATATPILWWRDGTASTSGGGAGGNRTMTVLVSDADTADVRVNAPTDSLNDDQWHHVAFTFEAGAADGLKIFIDGALVGTSSTASITSLRANGSPPTIGNADPTRTDRQFKGQIDSFAIFESTLTEADILAQFEARTPVSSAAVYEDAIAAQAPAFFLPFNETSGTVVNSTINTATGNITGTADLTATGFDPTDSAISFGAGTNRISIADNDPVSGATELSVSAWIKLDGSKLGTGDDHAIFVKGNFATGTPVLFWRNGADPGVNNTLTILVADSDTADVRVSAPTNSLNDTDWHHVAFTFQAASADGLKLYIDGVEVASRDTLAISSLLTNGSPITIGQASNQSAAKQFIGSMDSLAVFDTVLTAEQIQDQYYGGVGSIVQTLDAEADTYIQRSVPTTNFGDNTNLLIKFENPTANFNRKAYVRFDLSSVAFDHTNDLGDATLRLNFIDGGLGAGGTTTDWEFEVFGLIDGDAGEGWVEGNGGTDNNPAGEITWNNAPANDPTQGNELLGNATSLGTFNLFGRTGIVDFKSTELREFIKNSTADDLVTFIVKRTTQQTGGDTYVHTLASIEHATEQPAQLVLVQGDPPPASFDPIADAFIQQSSADENFGDASLLRIKLDGAGGQNNRKAYLKYDVSSLGFDRTNALGQATLDLNFVDSALGTGGTSVNWEFEVFGLVDGDPGEAWIEGDGGTGDSPAGEIDWNNAPANNTGAQNDLGGNAVSLGTFDLFGRTGTVSFSSSALNQFVATSADDLLTFIILRTTAQPDGGNTYVHTLASKESASTPSQLLLEEGTPSPVANDDLFVGASVAVSPEADAYIQGNVGTSNFGTEQDLLIKFGSNAGNGFNRKAYVRYDLSTLSIDHTTDVSGATLQLNFVDSGLGTGGDLIWDFEVFGLNDGDAGEAWSEGGINWNNAPANDSGTGNDVLGNATSLGTFSLNGKTGLVDFSSAALTSFIQNSTSDDLVTFIIKRNTIQPGGNQTYVHAIASKESADTPTQLLLATAATDEDAVFNQSAPGVLDNDFPDSAAVVDSDTTSANGAAVTVNADGSFTYDPTGSATIQALDDGDSLTDTFTYTIGSLADGDVTWNFDAGDGTAIANGIDATSITGGSGLTLDTAFDGGYATQPTLRVTDSGQSTLAGAIANNDYFEFTVGPPPGGILNLTSLTLDVGRGGGSTDRGFAVMSDVDGFTAGSEIFIDPTVDTQRPTFTNYVVDLSGAQFQGLDSAVNFRIYQFTANNGRSLEYDNFVLDGTFASGGSVADQTVWDFTGGSASATEVADGHTASDISDGAGITIDTNFDGGYATAPTLRVTDSNQTSLAGAIANNDFFEFTLSPPVGGELNLIDISVDVGRGGGSTDRGFAILSDVNGFTDGNEIFIDPTVDTQRPNFTNYVADLSGAEYQGVTTPITFRIYQFTANNGRSLEYDNLIIRSSVEVPGATDSATVSVTVAGLNDAPELDASKVNSFADVSILDFDNDGDTVADLLNKSVDDATSDVDASALARGIAIIGETGSGHFEFSTDGGSSWSDVNAAANDALLLQDTARVRYVPDGMNLTPGMLTFRAWDQSDGVEGDRFDLSSPASVGGTTAFSTDTGDSTVAVANVVIENGVLIYGAPDGEMNLIQLSVSGGDLVLKDLKGNGISGLGSSGASNMIMVPLADFTDLEINTGDENDVINVGDLGAFAGNLNLIGGDDFDTINYGDSNLVLGAGKSATFSADVINALVGSSLTTAADGGIDFDAEQKVRISPNAALSAGSGGLVIDANAGGTTSGNFRGIDASFANLTTTGGGDIALNGNGGDAGGFNTGVYLYQTDANSSGALMITGQGGAGIHLNNGVHIIGGSTTAAGDVTISGTGAGTGNLNHGLGFDAGVDISSTGGAVNLMGSAGAGLSNNVGVSMNRGGSISASAGLTISGTSSGSLTGNRGVYIANNASLDAGAGPLDIDGQGSSSATGNNNAGVELIRVNASAGTTATVDGTGGGGMHYNSGVILSTVGLTATDAVMVTGTGGDASGNANSGVAIGGLSNVESTGAMTTIVGEATGGLHHNTGVSITLGSTVSGNGVTINGTGAGTGSYNTGVKILASTVDAGAGDLNINAVGSAAGTGVGNNGIEVRGSTLIGSTASAITGTAGGGTNSFGAYMTGVSGNLMASNVMTDPDTDDEKIGSFFNILPLVPMILADADRRGRCKGRRGQTIGEDGLPSRESVQNMIDDILRDGRIEDQVKLGDRDLVVCLTECGKADVAAVENKVADELADSWGVREFQEAGVGSFRALFAFAGEFGFQFAVSIDETGSITGMRGGQNTPVAAIPLWPEADSFDRLSLVSISQNKLFSLVPE